MHTRTYDWPAWPVHDVYETTKRNGEHDVSMAWPASVSVLPELAVDVAADVVERRAEEAAAAAAAAS